MTAVEDLVYGENEVIEGETYAHWMQEWWRWILKIPIESNPSNDRTGEFSNQFQDADVYFLGGGVTGPAANKWRLEKDTVTREINVPRGKPVLVPAAVGIVSIAEFPDLFDDKTLGNAYTMDRYKAEVTFLQGKIDGLVIEKEGFVYQVTPVFNVKYGENNIFDVHATENTPAVSEGFWLCLKPRNEDFNVQFSQRTEANQELNYHAFEYEVNCKIHLT